MYQDNAPHSGSSSTNLSRRFLAKRPIGELVRSIDCALDNAHLAPRVRQDIGTREIQIDIANGVSLRISVVGSYHTKLIISAARSAHKAFGVVLAAIRPIPRLREQRVPLPLARAAAGSIVKAPDFAAQLARLGLRSDDVTTFVDFIDVLADAGVAIVTPRARQLAESCVYRKPVRLAQAMVDIILRTRTRTHGCCDQQLYGTLPGFRLNLSDAQRLQFRSDYVAVHAGCEYLGQLHVTLGASHSPARCASVHWVIRGVSGPVVFTRIGEHGRNAST